MLRLCLLLCLCLLGNLVSAQADLSIGLEPSFSPRMLVSGFAPMRGHLAKQLGREVMLYTAADYRRFLKQVETKQFDILLTGPHTARYAERVAGYRPLLQGLGRLKGLLVVKRGPHPITLHDLDEQLIALPDGLSATAMQAEAWIRQQKLHSALRYFDFHNAAAQAVLQGDAMAAFVSSNGYDSLPAMARQNLQVLAQTQALPQWIVLGRSSMPAAQQTIVQTALLQVLNAPVHTHSQAARLGFAGADLVGPAGIAFLDPLFNKLQQRLSNQFD